MTLFVLLSVSAHLVLLGGLSALVSGAAPTPPRVVEISALTQAPPPLDEQEPVPEPPPEAEEPADPSTPSCPAPQRATRRPAPRREMPAAARAPEPPPRQPEPVGGEQEPALPAPEAAPRGAEADHQVASSVPAGAPRAGSSEHPEGDGGRGQGRAAAEPDPCEEVTASLRSRIEAIKTYPLWARAMNITGTVRLTMRVGQDGRPRGVRVVGTSGDSRLDRHAQDTARRVGGLPPDCRRPISIPIRFDLVGSGRR